MLEDKTVQPPNEDCLKLEAKNSLTKQSRKVNSQPGKGRLLKGGLVLPKTERDKHLKNLA